MATVPMPQENTECIVTAVNASLPPEGRAQVMLVSTDDPSSALLSGLQSIVPGHDAPRDGVRVCNVARDLSGSILLAAI